MSDKLWIQQATKKKGALHRHLGIPEGTKIPLERLEAAAKVPGVIGSEARLALTLEKMHRKPRTP